MLSNQNLKTDQNHLFTLTCVIVLQAHYRHLCPINQTQVTMKNKLIGLAVIIVIFAIAFTPAYLTFDINKPAIQLFAFLSLIIGSLASWFISNKEVTEG